jgi:hypothetical protein
MSAHPLHHVREQLQQAIKRYGKSGAFEWIEYTTPAPLDWIGLVYAVEQGLAQGWLLEWQPGQVAVTKLRFVRPVNFSTTHREQISAFKAPGERQRRLASQGAKREDKPVVREAVTDSASTQTASRTPSTVLNDTAHQHYRVEREKTDSETDIVVAKYVQNTGKGVSRSARERVESALLFWPPDVLCRLLDAHAEPLTKLFRSAASIAALLGEPPPARPRDTWLTPYERAYADHWPLARFRHAMWARFLGPLERRHGPERTLQEFRGYLGRTDASYLSPGKFSDGFGSWVGKGALMSHSGPVTIKVV